MHQRIEIIADVAGIKVGDTITEELIEKLATTIAHDMLHYIFHVNSGKYEDVKTAITRIEQLIRESYGLK